MTDSYPHPFATVPAPRRMTGVAVTILIHALLLLGWHMLRTLPAEQRDEPRAMIQWIDLPALPRREAAPTPAEPVRRTRPDAGSVAQVKPPTRAAAPDTAITVAPEEPVTAPPAAPPSLPSAETILEKARRSAGAVDRALRKENRPYIVAPLDSPQIRMRNGMARAHDLAPTELWEAPKVEELVNQTGDGARRTRVISGKGTYCITERSPATNVEMIEHHGKQRFTNCPQHEDTANGQAWRTARD
jgi:hypothetical protein